MAGGLCYCKINGILISREPIVCADAVCSEICFPHLLFDLAAGGMLLSRVRFCCIPGQLKKQKKHNIFNELLYNCLAPALVLMKVSRETMHSFLPQSIRAGIDFLG